MFFCACMRVRKLLHTFNDPFSETMQVSRYQKGKTNLDFTEARDSEWQWHQLGRMQVCTSLQTDNHRSTSPLSFFTGRMPFLPPNQQRQSTEGKSSRIIVLNVQATVATCHAERDDALGVGESLVETVESEWNRSLFRRLASELRALERTHLLQQLPAARHTHNHNHTRLHRRPSPLSATNQLPATHQSRGFPRLFTVTS